MASEPGTPPKDEYEGKYEPHTTLGSNRPLRGWKTDLYEGGIRVPCCVNWPGRITAGGTIDSPTCITDWTQTFCAMSGSPAESSWGLPGRDIWPLILGETEAPPRTLYWRTRSRLALRLGEWKLITNNSYSQIELYNLASDPNEESNIAEKNPDRVAQLMKHLKEQREADLETSPREGFADPGSGCLKGSVRNDFGMSFEVGRDHGFLASRWDDDPKAFPLRPSLPHSRLYVVRGKQGRDHPCGPFFQSRKMPFPHSYQER